MYWIWHNIELPLDNFPVFHLLSIYVCWLYDNHAFILLKMIDLSFLQVVTCGNFPLESSYSKVPRCVYTSTSLYEYRGWDSKAANSKHRHFTWGLRSMEVCLSLIVELNEKQVIRV